MICTFHFWPLWKRNCLPRQTIPRINDLGIFDLQFWDLWKRHSFTILLEYSDCWYPRSNHNNCTKTFVYKRFQRCGDRVPGIHVFPMEIKLNPIILLDFASFSLIKQIFPVSFAGCRNTCKQIVSASWAIMIVSGRSNLKTISCQTISLIFQFSLLDPLKRKLFAPPNNSWNKQFVGFFDFHFWTLWKGKSFFDFEKKIVLRGVRIKTIFLFSQAWGPLKKQYKFRAPTTSATSTFPLQKARGRRHV